MDRVALVRCREYELKEVKDALREGLAFLGGLDSFVGCGEQVLVKVNCLMTAAPERAVTTHPVFLRAVLQLLRERTDRLWVGDSPGYMPFLTAARSIGYDTVAAEEGAELVEFHEDMEIENPRGLLYKRFKVSSQLVQADRVINLPKLKTHGLMYLTGCVKNMFGTIPGIRKTTYHLKARQDKWLFAKTLVDIYGARPPTLNLMDGIVGMEGNGPANGHPVPLGVILLGVNGFAVDEVMARVTNAPPERVYTNAVYRKFILGGEEPSIELLGTPLAEVVKNNFQHIHDSRSVIPEWAFNFGKNLVSPRQIFLREKCIRCMVCVKSCPVEALRYEEREGILCDDRRCIRCFICQEMCPAGAIELRRGLLARLIR